MEEPTPQQDETLNINRYDDEGDAFYMDEFGEQINRANALGDDDLMSDSLELDDLPRVPDESASQVDNDFRETLTSEHIDDQLSDPELSRQAEEDLTEDDSI